MRFNSHINSFFLIALLLSPNISLSNDNKTTDSTGSNLFELFEDSKKSVRRILNNGDAASLYLLGVEYKEGRDIKQDDSESVLLFQKAADLGNASAQNALGFMYQQGRGVNQDDQEAVKWFSEAAKKNNANAQYNLAIMIGLGLGTQKNEELGKIWFDKAAEQGQLHAKVLWVLNENHDPKDRLSVLRKAAENGYEFALMQYGDLYYKGKSGVQVNYSEALKWWTKAAVNDSVFGQREVGTAYLKGLKNEAGDVVIQEDIERALEWLRKAANNNLRPRDYGEVLDFISLSGANHREKGKVQWILGNIYLSGDRVRQDKERAKEYYGTACDSGSKLGCRKFKELN